MKILLLTISAEKTQKEERFYKFRGGKLISSGEPLLWYLPYLRYCPDLFFMVVMGCETVEQALSLAPEKPDLIFINDNTQSGFYPDLYKFNIPKVFYIEDLHTHVVERTEYITKQKINYVIVNYKEGFEKTYPTLKDRMVWIPHSIDPNFHTNYNQERDIDCMLLGRVHGVYPFRMWLVNNIPDLFYNKVPGWDRFYNRNLEYFGINYVKYLNKAKITYASGSRYNYPLKKHFEIPACGAMLMTNHFKDLDELGYKHKQNCMFINESNAIELTKHALEYNEMREGIARQGEQFIKENHTWQNRADTFMKFLKEKIK